MTDPGAGARVRLRDVTLADADLYDDVRRREHSDGGFNDFGLEPQPIDRGVLADGPPRNEGSGTMFIERIADGEVIGTVGWRTVSYGPNPESRALMFGIDLAPEARGRGYGTEAQRLLAELLFATTTVNRIEASTDVENLAEQRSLEKAGYVREGVNRQAQFRGGAYHDLVLYARLRSDPR
jgi:RimJ/RimL family protein N-acetyltransferase